MRFCGGAWPIGVDGRTLTAIKFLYGSGTLSMKISGTAGDPKVQPLGVRQGCPLSPTLFGIIIFLMACMST